MTHYPCIHHNSQDLHTKHHPEISNTNKILISTICTSTKIRALQRTLSEGTTRAGTTTFNIPGIPDCGVIFSTAPAVAKRCLYQTWLSALGKFTRAAEISNGLQQKGKYTDESRYQSYSIFYSVTDKKNNVVVTFRVWWQVTRTSQTLTYQQHCRLPLMKGLF